MLLEKYQPKSTRDVLGNYGQIRAIRNWIARQKKGQALLVYGPTGCGKSISVKLAAKELGFNVIESHASDYRDKAGFDELITAARHSMLEKKKLLLIEDAELVESRKALYNLISSSPCPVVLVAESMQNLYGLVRSCTTIKFSKAPDSMLIQFLKRISLAENINLNEQQLSAIVKSCNGDVRAALIDLEFQAVGSRERTPNIFEIVRAVFKNEGNARELLEQSQMDTLMAWISENIAEEIKAAAEMASAYDYLSKADIMRARILKRQSWVLQKYVNELLLRGLSVSRSRPRLLGSYRAPAPVKKVNKNTMEKIGRATHTSKKGAPEYLAVVKMLADDEDFCSNIGFDEDDIEFVKSVN